MSNNINGQNVFQITSSNISMLHYGYAISILFVLIFSIAIIPVIFADTVQSPREQLAKGILPELVRCREGFVWVEKLFGDSVACVKPQTAENLAKHGWGIYLPTLTNPAYVFIVRWNSSENVLNSTFNNLGNQMITKYGLQNAMTLADKQFNRGESPDCGKLEYFMNLGRPPLTNEPPCLIFQMSMDLGKEMIKDPNLAFQESGGFWETFVHVGDAKYRLVFSNLARD